MNKRGVDNKRMRSKLLDYLKDTQVICDYVFVTGDLRYAPEGAFDKETASFLKDLCNAVGVPVEKMYIVPGNHDIDRGNADRSTAIEELIGSTGKYNSKDGIIQDDVIKSLKTGRNEFVDIIKQIYSEHPDRISYYTDEKTLHFCVETEDFNIIHLDSTITYTRDNQRDFILGTEQVMNALQVANPEKPSIILTHYSWDYIMRSEQKVLLNILMDYHTQLWIAGHEHDELFRKQRDYFYEFQCGNLIYEGDDTRSCIAIGEYNASENSGCVQLYYWDSPKGWALYPFASTQDDRERYKFELMDNVDVAKHMSAVVHSDDFKKISDNEVIFNIHEMTPEKVHALEEMGFLEVKNELGNRLRGNESENEVVQMFLYELNSSFNSEKRYECIPLFRNVVRDIFDCYLHLDGNFAPFMKSTVTHFYFDDVDRFVIHNDTIHLEIITVRREIAYMTFAYNLSRFDSATERLLHFKKITEYLESNKVFIRMVNHEQYNLSYDTNLHTKEWQENIERTQFWIAQMNNIALIEEYYGIRFKLTEKATEDECVAIDILSDSIKGQKSRCLPSLPMKSPGFRKHMHLDNDIYIDNADYLPSLWLFGYLFIPVSQYVIAGDYYWSKRKKGWLIKNNNIEGVPVRVEFEVCFNEDKNRELVKRIPFSEVENEFSNKNICCITGSDADFFQYYVDLTHDVQEIWQLYLAYDSQLKEMQNNDLINIADNNRSKGREGDIVDKLTANNLTNSMVAAGNMLIEHIDRLTKNLGFDEIYEFSRKWLEDNPSYLWLSIMRHYSSDGHFPLSINKEGWCYYDIATIEYELKGESNLELLECMDFFKESFEQAKMNQTCVYHYDIIRNYMLCIAQKLNKYYEIIKDVLERDYNKMEELINTHPELVIQDGKFENHVVYILNDEEEMHAYRKDSDIMMDYYKFAKEAEKHLKLCLIGCK